MRTSISLTVAEGKKLRLVLDLRNVNPYVHKIHYKYEDLDTVTDLLEKGDFFTIFDLVSAYYHINVHPDFHKYLGFQWTFRNGQTKFFQYQVLVFGLFTAGYIFTKVMRCLVKHWQSKGFRSLFYLDDGFNIDQSSDDCLNSTKAISQDLRAAGFLVNEEKSELTPTQDGEWLGVHLNTQTMQFTIPEKKLQKL